jgi:hypothetical protein
MKFATIILALVAIGVGVRPAAADDEDSKGGIRVIHANVHQPSDVNDKDHPRRKGHDQGPDVPFGGGGNARPGGGAWTDTALQASYPSPFAATLLTSSEGIGADGVAPPDPNVAVGDTQVVEIVNVEFAVFDKTGTMVQAPAPIHTLFAGLGGMCETQDGGDPIVLFDRMAHRWFISQLEYNSDFSDNLLCTAVSTSADATGSYVAYEWDFGPSLPDYPKIGVWPDAYYFSANIFYYGAFFLGADACAFDRNAMINGQPAVGLCFSTSQPSLLPASLDGSMLPNAGAPGLYVRNNGTTGLALYRFHVDFVNTNLSTFRSVNVPVTAFHLACGNGGTCVPQPGTTQLLDSLGDRLMYRLSYRNFGTYESLLVNHSVQIRSSSTQTGVRWYELRNPYGTPSVYQKSTFSPDTTQYRWMGSISQDKQGNMLLGYSASSSTLFPSIGYSGRLVTDPPNQLQSEFVSFFGTGSQTINRWGDYSSVAVDPVDDCTFWFAGEYFVTTGTSWHTRLESLKFPGCLP